MKACDENIKMAMLIAKKTKELHGRAYYVGGYVRDKFRGEINKDIDLEIHGITPNQLGNILDSLGKRISIGESFGIYALKGYSLDIAMPRREENRGRGHKDFDVCVAPDIGTRKAAMRRDFTINAIMQDVLTGEITDHFCGVQDLRNGVIRHVDSDTFPEDPLRVLRAAQFAARFNYTVADETVGLCKQMDIKVLPPERIMGELEKALLKSEKPSVFFETLRNMEHIEEWFPELADLIGVEQNPEYHSEGNVWNHTMLVLDNAAAFRDRVENKLGYMLAALTHDFGKAICSELINGKIHSYDHERKGVPLVETFITRLTTERALLKYIISQVENHMRPNMLAANDSSIKATNRMFDSVKEPEALICLALADAEGSMGGIRKTNEEFLYERLHIYNEYMSRPYVMGKDLIEAGLSPGRDFTEYLEYAHKLRLAGVDKKDALAQTLAYAGKRGDKQVGE